MTYFIFPSCPYRHIGRNFIFYWMLQNYVSKKGKMKEWREKIIKINKALASRYDAKWHLKQMHLHQTFIFRKVGIFSALATVVAPLIVCFPYCLSCLLNVLNWHLIRPWFVINIVMCLDSQKLVKNHLSVDRTSFVVVFANWVELFSIFYLKLFHCGSVLIWNHFSLFVVKFCILFD